MYCLFVAGTMTHCRLMRFDSNYLSLVLLWLNKVHVSVHFVYRKKLKLLQQGWQSLVCHF